MNITDLNPALLFQINSHLNFKVANECMLHNDGKSLLSLGLPCIVLFSLTTRQTKLRVCVNLGIIMNVKF